MVGFKDSHENKERDHILQADLKKLGILGCGGFGVSPPITEPQLIRARGRYIAIYGHGYTQL